MIHLVERDQRAAADDRVGIAQALQRCLAIVQADQGENRRVLEKAIAVGPQGGQQRRHGIAMTDPAQGRGRIAPNRVRVAGEELNELRSRIRIAAQADAVRRRLADAGRLIRQRGAHGGFRFGAVDARQRPDRISPRFH